MTDPTAVWISALAFLAGYGAGELQHRIRAHLRSMGPPRGRYSLPPDHDWRRTPNPPPRDLSAPIKPEFPPPRVIREDFLP